MKKSAYEQLRNNKLDLDEISNSIVTVSCHTAHINHLKELSKDNYDLVYGNTHIPTFYSMLGKLKRMPLVFDMHGGLIEEFFLNNQFNSMWKHPLNLHEHILDRIIDFTNLHFSNKIVCVSNKMISYLHKEKQVPLDKMAYVTNGVDLDFFKSVDNDRIQTLRDHLGLSSKFVCGYIGNFQKWQGTENFIEATKMIDDSDIAFIMVGATKESRGRNVLFIPNVPRNQIPIYYSMCDILVLPRPNHPATEIAAPTKFAEYASMSKPILTTNVGDAASFVKRYNCGGVIEDNSIKNLVKGINMFKDKSEKELKIMGKKARKLAENEFDWNKVGIKLLDVVESFE